jgi:putrescine transport system substrate-binding protein
MTVRFAASTLALVLGAVPVQAADVSVSETDPDRVLNVYNWSDYISPDVLDGFARETGIAVSYEAMDSNELLETRLMAGRTGFDVVFPSGIFLGQQAKMGLYRKLDKARIPNLGNLDPDLMGKLGRLDPGNEHAAIYMWGTSGIAYNDEAVRSRMPDAPVDSLAMLFDPQVVSKFADCGVSILDAPSEVVGTVLLYLGKDANSEKPEDLAEAERVLLSIRPFVRKVHSSVYIEGLASGEICLALGWSGDVLQARTRSEEVAKPFHIEYRVAREGAMMFIDTIAIPADAEHVNNAHLFINYLLRRDVQVANSRFVGFPSGLKLAKPLISTGEMRDLDYFPTLEIQKKLAPDLPESMEFARRLQRTWAKFRLGK